jgi:predicted PurR-regulated permease PerM
MINKKINRIFSCIFFIFSLFLLILSIVNSFILSSKTEAYKNFYKLVDDNYEYVQILLYNNHYYEINTEKEINKIIDDFIDLKENESFSATSRIIISFLSVIFTLFFFYFSLKIK